METEERGHIEDIKSISMTTLEKQLAIEEFIDDLSKPPNFDQPPRKKIKLVKAKKRLEFPCRQGYVLTPI